MPRIGIQATHDRQRTRIADEHHVGDPFNAPRRLVAPNRFHPIVLDHMRIERIGNPHHARLGATRGFAQQRLRVVRTHAGRIPEHDGAHG